MKTSAPWRLIGCLLVSGSLPLHAGENGLRHDLIQEEFNFRSTVDGTEPLKALVMYPQDAVNAPLMIYQHGYWGQRTDLIYSMKIAARQGIFCLSMDTRGWGYRRRTIPRKNGTGRDIVISDREKMAAGDHDEGGIETHDVLDGLNATLQRYAERIDADRVGIAGYSYGGGIAALCTMRYPYHFRAGISFFGMVDYQIHADEKLKTDKTYGKNVFRAITGKQDATYSDITAGHWMSRSPRLAVLNLRGPLMFAWDEEERICPPRQSLSVVEAARQAGMSNVSVHISRITDDPRVRLRHGYNKGQLTETEERFLTLFLQQTRPLTFPNAGELVVLGHLVTPRFSVFAGNGHNAVARLKYKLDPQPSFDFTPVSPNHDAEVRVILHGENGEVAESTTNLTGSLVIRNDRHRIRPDE